MLLETQIFKLYNGKYRNIGELAQAMGISVCQISGVQQGKRSIDEKFIIGALKAFPEYGIGHLFYLTPGSSF